MMIITYVISKGTFLYGPTVTNCANYKAAASQPAIDNLEGQIECEVLLGLGMSA